MKLVENVKQAWTWFSVQSMALAGALQATWLLLPDDLKISIPANVVQAVTLVLLVLGVAGRLVKQDAEATA